MVDYGITCALRLTFQMNVVFGISNKSSSLRNVYYYYYYYYYYYSTPMLRN